MSSPFFVHGALVIGMPVAGFFAGSGRLASDHGALVAGIPVGCAPAGGAGGPAAQGALVMGIPVAGFAAAAGRLASDQCALVLGIAVDCAPAGGAVVAPAHGALVIGACVATPPGAALAHGALAHSPACTLIVGAPPVSPVTDTPTECGWLAICVLVGVGAPLATRS